VTDDLVIRPSSLTTFNDCPRRWAARNLRDEVAAAGYTASRSIAMNAGAAVGSGVHAAVAYTLGQKIATGGASIGTDADAEEAGIVEVRERVEKEGFDADKATPDLNTAERQIRRMSRAYRRSDAVAETPLQSEERLEAVIADGIALSGQVDALMVGDPDQTVRDLKTGTSRRANGVQYGAYALIWRAHGHRPQLLVEDYLRRVPLAHEQPMPEPHRIDVQTAMLEAWETIDAIARAVAEFRRRAADPNGRPPNMAFRSNPGSSLCSARWCPAWGTDFCQAHLKD
jgi:hypothetical protein